MYDRRQASDLQFSEAVETVYDAVLDRSRFEELIHLALQLSGDEGREAEFQALREALDTHIQTAEVLLNNIPLEPADSNDVPVFSVDDTGIVLKSNKLSETLLQVMQGQSIFDACVSDDMSYSKDKRAEKLPPVLRLRRIDSGKPYLMVIQPDSQVGKPLIYQGAETLWNEDASVALQTIFGLTPSEAKIAGLLISGLSPIEISERRGRSVDTVRQQIKAIYEKTGCKGLLELLHLARAVLISVQSSSVTTPKHTRSASRHELILKDGRTMDYYCQGSMNGEAILFIHGCLCGPLFPEEASDYLKTQNRQLISPARPGHGRSSKRDALLDDPSSYADDIIELMDHLQIETIHIVCFDIGGIFGLCISSKLGKRLTSLTCVSAHPPIRSLRDIAAMPQQQRIFSILPKVSLPLLRFLAKTGDRRLKRDGADAFPATVFAGSDADLKVCEDPMLLDLFWTGHLFHVENGSDGFISDCRLAASQWIDHFQPNDGRQVFLHGGKNATIPPKRIKQFAESIGAKVTIIPDAGHSLPFSHWREVFSSFLIED